MNGFLASYGFVLVALVKVIVVVIVLLTVVAYLSWFERKVVAHIQSRWGPERVGPYGLIQPLADGAKFLFKEDPTPEGVDRFVFFFAPFLALALAMTTIAVMPLGPRIEIFGHGVWLSVTESNISLLVVFAITALSVYGVSLGGWASNNKYSLLGGLRSSAQMLSYELAMTMSVVGIVLMRNTFSLRDIVEGQRGAGGAGGFWHWFFIPQFFGFICFLISAVAETNRSPFDLAEGEQELVGGFHTEYASFKFAMYFMAEYAAMVSVSFMVSVLFFGGYLSPFPDTPAFHWTYYLPAAGAVIGGLALVWNGLRYHTAQGRMILPVLGIVLAGVGVLCGLPGVMAVIQGPFWLAAKVFVMLFIYVWIRGTLPRIRYDQLMAFGWKFLLPLSLANVVVTAWLVMLRLPQ